MFSCQYIFIIVLVTSHTFTLKANFVQANEASLSVFGSIWSRLFRYIPKRIWQSVLRLQNICVAESIIGPTFSRFISSCACASAWTCSSLFSSS